MKIDKLRAFKILNNVTGHKWPSKISESSTRNKQELLALARSGKPRPHWKSLLRKRLLSYTNTNNGCYDSVFDKEIRRLRPDWCDSPSDKANIKKEELLKLAKSGKQKPYYKTNLGKSLFRYTNKNDPAYDFEFDKKIRKLRPDWFESQSDKAKLKKQELLALAKTGKPRPHWRNTLGISLFSYTRKTNICYDPVFDKEIRNIRPDWFKS